MKILLIGPPQSGKTYLANHLKNDQIEFFELTIEMTSNAIKEIADLSISDKYKDMHLYVIVCRTQPLKSFNTIHSYAKLIIDHLMDNKITNFIVMINDDYHCYVNDDYISIEVIDDHTEYVFNFNILEDEKIQKFKS